MLLRTQKSIACVSTILVYSFFFNVLVICNEIKITDYESTENPVKELWTSTGFSLPLELKTLKNFVHSDQFYQNAVLLGALPYHLQRLQIRIHWLLNLVTYSKSTGQFNFTELDRFLKLLRKYGLAKIGFELMGNPSKLFTNFEDEKQVWLWYKLVVETGTTRKLAMIGAETKIFTLLV